MHYAFIEKSNSIENHPKLPHINRTFVTYVSMHQDSVLPCKSKKEEIQDGQLLRGRLKNANEKGYSFVN